MTVQPIPLAQGQMSGIDELAGAMPLMANVITDGGGAIRVRPGLADVDWFPGTGGGAPVDGICTFGQTPVWVDSTRAFYACLSPGFLTSLSTTDPLTRLDGPERPVFAETYSKIVCVGGGTAQKWDGASATSVRLGGNPPAATHILANSQRLVLNHYGTDGQMEWTDPGETNHETWPSGGVGPLGVVPGGIAEADARPDPLIAIYDNINAIMAFGTDTAQVFVPDPNLGYAVTRVFNSGLGARYGVAVAEDNWYWLDHHRNFSAGSVGEMEDVSSPAVTRTVTEFGMVSDCWAFRWVDFGWDCIVFVFPSEGRTFVYDTNLKKWHEWRAFDGKDWQPIAFRCHFFWHERKEHLVGMPDGSIKKLTLSAATDAGAPIRASLRTGFVSHDTQARKQCQRIRLRLRRVPGVYTTGTEPRASVRYRADLGGWSAPLSFGVGGTNMEPVVELPICAVYRQMQWEFNFDSPLSIVGAEEVYDVLGEL